MANNRLYIYDPETGDKFMIAKSLSDGWYIKDPEKLGHELEAWLDGRDMSAAYSGTGSTELKLLTEGDLPAEDLQK